jgi:hypothetical protein
MSNTGWLVIGGLGLGAMAVVLIVTGHASAIAWFLFIAFILFASLEN